MTSHIFKKIIFFSAVIILWQAVASFDLWPDQIFPSPYEIAEDLAYGVLDGSLFYGIGTSMIRLIVGLFIAIVGGVMLGVLMARVETVNQTIGSLVLGLQSIPSVAWVPLALIWFGVTDAGIIFVTVIGAIFAVTINTHSGVKNIDPHYVEAARNMGAGGSKLVFYVLLPACISFYFLRIQTGMGICILRGVHNEDAIFLTPECVFIVTAKMAPITVTKIIPASVTPNHIRASGTHATEGIDCKPSTNEPIV